MPTPHTAPAAPAQDWVDIVTVVTRMTGLADARDWDRLVEVFADRVTLDYTSVAGGRPATLTPAEVVTAWQATLGRLDATQHLVANHVVDVDGDTAVATAQFQAVHVLANRYGDPTWTLGGRYRFGLVRTAAGWRIDAVTMTATWATGNQHVMTLAGQEVG